MMDGQKNGVDIDIHGLAKIYQTREEEEVVALEDINLHLGKGSFISVVGPSGCGKSTLLSLLAGLSEITKGSIAINGEKVTKPHGQIGVVFQTDLLLYWRSVLDNIILPLEIKKLDAASHKPKAQALLEQVGLQGFGNKYPSELSGGMRQRVAICRALIQEPGLLLMDEPFGALDALTREQMIIDLQAMWLKRGNSVVFITHDIQEAVFLADRVLVMSPRPGRIDLDLIIDMPRPRLWNEAPQDKKYQHYIREIRAIFESKGILKTH